MLLQILGISFFSTISLAAVACFVSFQDGLTCFATWDSQILCCVLIKTGLAANVYFNISNGTTSFPTSGDSKRQGQWEDPAALTSKLAAWSACFILPNHRSDSEKTTSPKFFDFSCSSKQPVDTWKVPDDWKACWFSHLNHCLLYTFINPMSCLSFRSSVLCTQHSFFLLFSVTTTPWSRLCWGGSWPKNNQWALLDEEGTESAFSPSQPNTLPIIARCLWVNYCY